MFPGRGFCFPAWVVINSSGDKWSVSAWAGAAHSTARFDPLIAEQPFHLVSVYLLTLIIRIFSVQLACLTCFVLSSGMCTAWGACSGIGLGNVTRRGNTVQCMRQADSYTYCPSSVLATAAYAVLKHYIIPIYPDQSMRNAVHALSIAGQCEKSGGQQSSKRKTQRVVLLIAFANES